MLKVLAVCGAGVGSSMMLKVFTEQILQAEGVEARVSTIDIGSVGLHDADIIITTPDLAKRLRSTQATIIELVNLMDKATLKKELLKVVHSRA